jgi:hypothetical protein
LQAEGKFKPDLLISMSYKSLFTGFIITVFAVAGFGFTLAKLVKTKVTNDITVSLPAVLFPMTPEDIGQRFPSVRAPLGAYTTEDRVVDFSVNISATQWYPDDYEMSQKFFRSGIYNLYDKVEMLGEGIHEIHKKKFIFFEFESRTNGDRRKLGASDAILKYTYIQYYIEPKRTLVFTFSCPRDRKAEWQELVHEMMNSVRVK